MADMLLEQQIVDLGRLCSLEATTRGKPGRSGFVRAGADAAVGEFARESGQRRLPVGPALPE